MSRSTTRPEESRPRFKVGSQAFFSQYPGFRPSDLDELEFEEHPKLYRNFIQIRAKDRSRCLFRWRKMSADEFVQYSLASPLPMEVGKFLVPEVAEYIGMTIDHLKQLRPVFDKLDAKHAYEKVIYDSYIQNGSFTLLDEQRFEAFVMYLEGRKQPI